MLPSRMFPTSPVLGAPRQRLILILEIVNIPARIIGVVLASACLPCTTVLYVHLARDVMIAQESSRHDRDKVLQ